MTRPTTPLLTVDAVVFDAGGRLLLIERKNPPFAGAFALPGGFVDVGETVEAACRRELAEETGLHATTLELIGLYSDPSRDPRFHTCSAAFLVSVKHTAQATAGDDAADLAWRRDWRRLELAFDHRRIVEAAVRLRRPSASKQRHLSRVSGRAGKKR